MCIFYFSKITLNLMEQIFKHIPMIVKVGGSLNVFFPLCNKYSLPISSHGTYLSFFLPQMPIDAILYIAGKPDIITDLKDIHAIIKIVRPFPEIGIYFCVRQSPK